MTPPIRTAGRMVFTCVSLTAVLATTSAWAQRTPVDVPAGSTTGQNSISVFGTSGQSLGSDITTTVPGLTTTINAPTNSVTIVSTDGGVEFGVPGAAKVDIKILVDGAALPNGGYQRVFFYGPMGVGASSHWSMQVSLELKPGSHTIEVQARRVMPVGPGGIIVGGNAASGIQGTLTVTTLKR